MVLDRLAQQEGLGFSAASKWDCLWTRWNEVILMKPMTYMNRSGDSVAGVLRYFRIEPSELLVVVDDVALPLGRLRLRSSGSDGGHNGLGSIIAHLGENFPRFRVGVGGGANQAVLVDQVLSSFSKTESAGIEPWVEEGTGTNRQWVE